MSIQRARNSFRIVWTAIAFVTIGLAGVALAAPADAALRGVAVDTPAGYGSSAGSTNYDVYGAGCAYKLDIIVDNPKTAKSKLKVTSTTNGKTVTIYNQKPTTVAVTPTWRPATPGRYVLAATLDGVTKQRTVNVGTGVQLPWFVRGGACFVVPIY